jgi:hypothetical protein
VTPGIPRISGRWETVGRGAPACRPRSPELARGHAGYSCQGGGDQTGRRKGNAAHASPAPERHPLTDNRPTPGTQPASTWTILSLVAGVMVGVVAIVAGVVIAANAASAGRVTGGVVAHTQPAATPSGATVAPSPGQPTPTQSQSSPTPSQSSATPSPTPSPSASPSGSPTASSTPTSTPTYTASPSPSPSH